MVEKIRNMEKIIEALKTLRVGTGLSEAEIHNEIAKALDANDVCYFHEYVLGPRCRVDFYIDGVAIEVKKGKPNRTQLAMQINRYAEFDIVDAVIIVVETSLYNPISRTWNGKPCHVLGLQKLWGIAL